MNPVRLIVYSDYLCPWCYNASVRMDRIREEFGPEVEIEWRSFLLRPEARADRDLERFRRYTESWRRPASEPDAGTFRVWEGEAGPPTHSLPPHQVAKAAARVSDEAFHRVHDALLHAYFAESRDVTSDETLREVWEACGLPPGRFDERDDPGIIRRILAEHEEAHRMGATGVPAIRRADQEIAITGAHPVDFYRRWVRRIQAEPAETRASP